MTDLPPLIERIDPPQARVNGRPKSPTKPVSNGHSRATTKTDGAQRQRPGSPSASSRVNGIVDVMRIPDRPLSPLSSSSTVASASAAPRPEPFKVLFSFVFHVFV